MWKHPDEQVQDFLAGPEFRDGALLILAPSDVEELRADTGHRLLKALLPELWWRAAAKLNLNNLEACSYGVADIAGEEFVVDCNVTTDGFAFTYDYRTRRLVLSFASSNQYYYEPDALEVPSVFIDAFYRFAAMQL